MRSLEQLSVGELAEKVRDLQLALHRMSLEAKAAHRAYEELELVNARVDRERGEWKREAARLQARLDALAPPAGSEPHACVTASAPAPRRQVLDRAAEREARRQELRDQARYGVI